MCGMSELRLHDSRARAAHVVLCPRAWFNKRSLGLVHRVGHSLSFLGIWSATCEAFPFSSLTFIESYWAPPPIWIPAESCFPEQPTAPGSSHLETHRAVAQQNNSCVCADAFMTDRRLTWDLWVMVLFCSDFVRDVMHSLIGYILQDLLALRICTEDESQLLPRQAVAQNLSNCWSYSFGCTKKKLSWPLTFYCPPASVHSEPTLAAVCRIII